MYSKQQIDGTDRSISKHLYPHAGGKDFEGSHKEAREPDLGRRAPLASGALTRADVLQLQRTAGNQAVAQMLAGNARAGLTPRQDASEEASRFLHALPPSGRFGGNQRPSCACAMNGLQGGGEPDQMDEDLNGRTFGEFVGDVARPVETAVGNVVGSIAGILTGIDISSTTNTGPTWSDHGRFNWRVGFSTTGRNGWIVQEIVNTFRAQTATGGAVTVPAPPVPHFWEAWAVDGSGNVTPHDAAGNNDYWVRASRGNNTEGHWSTTGAVHFTTTDPATQGFLAHNPATNAGKLLSSTSAPSGLGFARLHRYAQGSWDSTGTTPTHTGSAGP